MFAMCGTARPAVRARSKRVRSPGSRPSTAWRSAAGLELTLACRERYLADDATLQIGVPEVRWGLLPGAGGTQRLPRLAPFEPAMEMLLHGSIDRRGRR
jgi:3-hydroxyacyl-CoA dehydrogenase/enoyl-CoA hydratase/3-hydroxybutyryl-CoA epimerase